MRRLTGMTLIELMVTVAILSVIAAIAYPMYTDQMRKARRAEAKAAATKLALAEEQYRSRRGVYLPVAQNDLDDIEDLGLDRNEWDPSAAGSIVKHYSFQVNTTNANTRFSVTLTPTAGGGQDSDSACTSFSIDQLGTKTATGTLGDACW